MNASTDIKDFQILKAMYAAGDELIANGVITIKKVLTASQIVSHLDKVDGLAAWTENIIDSGARDGYVVEIVRAVAGKETSDGITMRQVTFVPDTMMFHFVVDTFRCTVPASSLFRIIVRFEQITGIGSSRHTFAPKREESSVVLSLVVTKQLKSLPAYCEKKNEIRPTFECVWIDTQRACACATDGHILQLCGIDLSYDVRPDFDIIIPAEIIRKAKAGDKLTIDAAHQIAINDNVRGYVVDGSIPNFYLAFPMESLGNMWDVSKDWAKIKKSVKSLDKFTSSSSHLLQLHINGTEWQMKARDLDFAVGKDETIHLTSPANGQAQYKEFYCGLRANHLASLANVERFYVSADGPSCAVVYACKDGVIGLIMPLLLDYSYNIYKHRDELRGDGRDNWQLRELTKDIKAEDVADYGLIYGTITSLKNAQESTAKHNDKLADVELYNGDYNETVKVVALPSVHVACSVPAVITTKQETIESSRETFTPAFVQIETKQPETFAPVLMLPYIDCESNESDGKASENIVIRLLAVAAVYLIALFVGINLFADSDDNNIKAATMTETASHTRVVADTVNYSAKQKECDIKHLNRHSENVDKKQVMTPPSHNIARAARKRLQSHKIAKVVKCSMMVLESDTTRVLKQDSVITDTVNVEAVAPDTIPSNKIVEAKQVNDKVEPEKLTTLKDNGKADNVLLAIIPLLPIIIGPRKNHSFSNVSDKTDMEKKIIADNAKSYHTFDLMMNVGTVKYLITYYTGERYNDDGSIAGDVHCFKNKRKANAFARELLKAGYKATYGYSQYK